MKNRIADMSPRKAARAAGLAFLIMFVFAILAELLILSKIIVEGDAAATINNIMASGSLFWAGIAGWLIILALDVVVALLLYVVLKQVNINLALLSMVLRLVYTAIMAIAFLTLVLLFPDLFRYGKLIAYIFFISHLFVLGYLVYKSGYIPKILGAFLILSAFSYIITIYGDFLLPEEWYNTLFMIAMLPATFAEPALAVWLLFKSAKIPEMKS